MAIAGYKPVLKTDPSDNLPRIEPDGYASILTDDRYIPLQSLIPYIEGYPWTVNYYNQLLTEHTDLRDLDPGQLAIYQQYSKINNLEIQVTSPLTETQDSETALVTVQGSGLVYPFVTPNISDYFIASVGDGKDGLFRISAVERKSFHRLSVYEIQYTLVSFISKSDERYVNLEEKTKGVYYFNKERLIEGLPPTLTESKHQLELFLKNFYREACKDYFSVYFNREQSTLIIPHQEVQIYDPLIVDFILKIVEIGDAPEIYLVKKLNMEYFTRLKETQLWDMLIKRDSVYLSRCNRQMGIMLSANFSTSVSIGAFRFLKLNGVVYPMTRTPLDPSERVFIFPPNDFSSVIKENLPESSDYSIIKPVLIDSDYVLSHEFYLRESPLSLLESTLLDYLDQKTISAESIKVLCEHSAQWDKLEQFYYIPLVLLLIKAAISALY